MAPRPLVTRLTPAAGEPHLPSFLHISKGEGCRCFFSPSDPGADRWLPLPGGFPSLVASPQRRALSPGPPWRSSPDARRPPRPPPSPSTAEGRPPVRQSRTSHAAGPAIRPRPRFTARLPATRVLSGRFLIKLDDPIRSFILDVLFPSRSPTCLSRGRGLDVDNFTAAVPSGPAGGWPWEPANRIVIPLSITNVPDTQGAGEDGPSREPREGPRPASPRRAGRPVEIRDAGSDDRLSPRPGRRVEAPGCKERKAARVPEGLVSVLEGTVF